MRYGYFDDAHREYVVERPDTPWPWINYLGDDEYCGIISNNAGGYSYYQSAGENRLLRYRFNAVPCDRSGRYLYLRDASDGEYWSNSWSPTQKPLHEQQTECRHGQGYTRISSSYHGITSSALYFVPLDDPLEIWDFTIANTSDCVRNIDVFSYCEFGFPYFLLKLRCRQFFMWRRRMCMMALLDTRPLFQDGARVMLFSPVQRLFGDLIASVKRSLGPGVVKTNRLRWNKAIALIHLAPGVMPSAVYMCR